MSEMTAGHLREQAPAAAGKAGPSLPARPQYRSVLWQYLLLTYLALLANASRYLWEIDQWGALTLVFALAVYLGYCAVFLAPVHALSLLWARLLFWRRLDRVLRRHELLRAAAAYVPAMLGFSAVQVLIYADVFVYRQWARHLDLFIWNLLATPGGFASMDLGLSSVVTFALIILGLVGVQAALLAAVVKSGPIRRLVGAAFPRKVRVTAVALAGAMLVFQAVTYGACKLRWYRPVLRAARAFPGYVPVTFSKLGRKLGLEAKRADRLSMRVGGMDLRYPLRPIERAGGAKRYNLVWLVVESWRADAVAPEVMPRTRAFAGKSIWFRNHYSGGNGTRMGMFALFYGLYGSYWFAMLEAQRSPVIMDLLQADGYQISLYTSQSFTYPEFDRTIFANVPREQMHTFGSGARACVRDQVNVERLLSFLARRDPDRPFMTFMFFETTHAKYDFLPENAIRQPFLEDFNYATMGPEDAPQIRNRYINSANCLDGHIGKVLEYLDRHGLLDSTIVILTGDHAEEFMEKGRWGHASECFHQEEELTPLILHAPGQAPREVTAMTSHLDVAATVLRLLGVTNPPEDYSLGLDLLGERRRQFTVINSWGKMAYADRDCKIIFPFRGEGLHEVTTLDDQPVTDEAADAILRKKLPQRVQLLRDMRRFRK